MRRIFLILALIFMMVLPVFGQTGSYTTNEFFYLPEYGAYGTDEYDEYNLYMQKADTQIKANKDDFDNFEVSDITDVDLTDIANLKILKYNSTSEKWECEDDGGTGFVTTSGTPVANDIARFTDANTIEGLSYAELKAALDLEIGTNIQAYDAGLLSLAGLTYVSDSFIKVTATDVYAIRTINETKTDLSLNYVENLKVKLDATQAPTVNNDVDEGYTVGSRWFDVTNDKEYACLDNTDGAAVWTETTQSGGDGGDVTKVGTPVNNQIGVWTGDGTIEGDANLTYDGTTLVLGTGQVNFPDEQNASADANTLDDYEEGSWTPAFKFGGNSVDMTYTTQEGLYIKIGRMVFVSGYLVLSAKGTSTGSATLTGLPFTSMNDEGVRASFVPRVGNITFADILQASVNINATVCALREVTEAGIGSALNDTDFANNSNMMFGVTYFTD